MTAKDAELIVNQALLFHVRNLDTSSYTDKEQAKLAKAAAKYEKRLEKFKTTILKQVEAL